MLKISDRQWNAVADAAGERFMRTLAADLARTYPELFHAHAPEAVLAHVRDRCAFAASRGLTAQRDAAAMVHAECAGGADFTAVPPDHWARVILDGDATGAQKGRRFSALFDALETAPGFMPVPADD